MPANSKTKCLTIWIFVESLYSSESQFCSNTKFQLSDISPTSGVVCGAVWRQSQSIRKSLIASATSTINSTSAFHFLPVPLLDWGTRNVWAFLSPLGPSQFCFMAYPRHPSSSGKTNSRPHWTPDLWGFSPAFTNEMRSAPCVHQEIRQMSAAASPRAWLPPSCHLLS